MLAAAIIVYLHILGGEGLQLTTFCSSPENEFVFQGDFASTPHPHFPDACPGRDAPPIEGLAAGAHLPPGQEWVSPTMRSPGLHL